MAVEGSERPRRVGTGTLRDAGDDRVIDLAAIEASARHEDAGWHVAYAPSSAAPRTPSRRVRWVLTVTLLSAVTLACATVAFVNYERATDWREHAQRLGVREAALRNQVDSARAVVEEAEDALASAEQRISAVRAEATTTHERLSAATSDAAALEARISALANEKAQMEDERWLAGAQRDRAAGLAVRTGVLGGDLRRCLQRVEDWAAGRPSPSADEGAWSAWHTEGDDVVASCGVLAGDFQQLSGQVR